MNNVKMLNTPPTEDPGQAAERRVHFQTALSECAQALLASQGEDRLERALEALLDATQATYVMVERNVDDPELGLCSVYVAEAEEDTTIDLPESDYWDLVPWARMPESRSRLEAGEPFVVIPEQLTGVEYELYAEDPYPVKSELDIPIFVDGRWEGLIGFADSEKVREWTGDDLVLLTTAAHMIGAFWEREMARQELRDAIRARDDLVAVMSHELRNPLTVVLGLADQLANRINEFDPDRSAEYAAMIHRHSQDMAFLIEDLLVACRGDLSHVKIDPEAVDLAQLVHETAALLPDQSLLSAEGADVPPAWADPVRVRQIIRNLLTNAQRYGGSELAVEVGSESGMVCINVRDNGEGIDEGDRQTIFERYGRAGKGSHGTDSVGLGLSVSRDLARLMGGDITYDHVSGWSEFRLCLPVAEDD
ncbi:MAG: GAF domain-containing sensor histidine kinase [Acidimicrobiia bacterium]